jgi:hypothetical protein
MVLAQMNVGSLTLAENLWVLFALMWGYLLLAFVFLNFTARRLGK